MQWHDDVQQNTEARDAFRLGKVTASQFGCFMSNQRKAFGEPAKRYTLQIAMEIITGKNQNLVSLMSTCYVDTNRSQ